MGRHRGRPSLKRANFPLGRVAPLFQFPRSSILRILLGLTPRGNFSHSSHRVYAPFRDSRNQQREFFTSAYVMKHAFFLAPAGTNVGLTTIALGLVFPWIDAEFASLFSSQLPKEARVIASIDQPILSVQPRRCGRRIRFPSPSRPRQSLSKDWTL